jgi:hypothetical protein
MMRAGHLQGHDRLSAGVLMLVLVLVLVLVSGTSPAGC